MRITSEQFSTLDKTYRALLVNSLSGFKSANLVGTVDDQGQQNLAMVSSVFHLGAHPPLVGMIMRPASVPRHTLENIISTGCYTINHVHPAIFESAHQTAARYDKTVSEFDAVGLTAEASAVITAPYVTESRLKFAVELSSQQELEANGTVLVIGKIVELMVDEAVVQPDGYVDIEALESVAVTGLDSYHTTQRLSRLSYAKPTKLLTRLAVDGSVATHANSSEA